MSSPIQERLSAPSTGNSVFGAPDVGRDDEVRLAVLLIVVIGLAAVLAAFLNRSGFVGSDFLSFADARDGLSPGYLFRPVFDHFVPGHRLVNWAVYRVAPLDFRLSIIVSVVCFAATLLAMHRLLAELLGPGTAPLLLTLFFGVSCIQVGTAVWWAASLSRLPANLFIVLTVLLHVRFRRTGRLGFLVGSVVALAAALMFSEDALLVPPLLVALQVLVLTQEESLRQSIRAVAREWRTWVPYLVPMVITLIGSTSQTTRLFDVQAFTGLVRYLGAAWFHAFTPALLGLFVDTGRLTLGEIAAVVLAQAALIGLAAWTIVRRPMAARRAWAFFLVGFIVTQAPVGLLRTDFFAPELVAHGYRYYSVTLVLFTVTLGALLGTRRASATAVPRHGFGRSGAAAVAVTVLALAYLASSLWGSFRITDEFHGRHAGRYLRNLDHDLRVVARPPGGFAVLDGEVPHRVIERLYAPSNRLSFVLPLFRRGYDVSTDAGNLYRVEPDGRLRSVTFTPKVGGRAGSLAAAGALAVSPGEAMRLEGDRICVRTAGAESVIGYELPQPVPDATWYLRIRYTSSHRRIGHVLVDRGAGLVSAVDPALPVRADRNEAVVALGDEGFSRLVIALQPHLDLCLEEFTLAVVEPR